MWPTDAQRSLCHRALIRAADAAKTVAATLLRTRRQVEASRRLLARPVRHALHDPANTLGSADGAGA